VVKFSTSLTTAIGVITMNNKMKRCTNCGIYIGGNYTIRDQQTGERKTRVRIEQTLHDFYGYQLCGWCVSLINDRGWITSADKNKNTIVFMDGSQFSVPLPLSPTANRNPHWQELKYKLVKQTA